MRSVVWSCHVDRCGEVWPPDPSPRGPYVDPETRGSALVRTVGATGKRLLGKVTEDVTVSYSVSNTQRDYVWTNT